MNLDHGEFSIQVKENLITLSLIGEFNEYSTRAYAAEIKSLVESFQGAPFLILVNNLNLVGATPEAYTESNKHNEWLYTTSMIGKATVYPNTFLADVDASRVSSKKYLNCRNFTNISKAKAWLCSLPNNKL